MTSSEHRDIPFSSLIAWTGNPRRTADPAKIEELASSMSANGQLQNLLVRPTANDLFEVIFGNRRRSAAALLVDRGDWTADHKLSCEVRELTDAEALKLAIAENFNRQNMTVMEEADAFADLLSTGYTVIDIAIAFGCSQITVERRVALAHLVPEAKDLFAKKAVSLEWAMALTIATPDTQREIATQAADPANDWARDPSILRTRFKQSGIPVAHALFARDAYTGSFLKDLFTTSDTERFADPTQFWVLQNEAIQRLKAEHEQRGATVRVVHDSPDFHNYQKAPIAGNDRTGTTTIIQVEPTGRVAIHEGLKAVAKLAATPTKAKQPTPPVTTAAPKTGKTTPGTSAAPDDSDDGTAVSGAVHDYVADHRIACVQTALTGDLRTTIAMWCVALLARGAFPHLTLPLYRFERSAEDHASEAFTLLLEQYNRMARALGLAEETSLPGMQVSLATSPAETLELLLGLPEAELVHVFSHLSARRFGIPAHSKADTGPTPITVAARHLGIQLRNLWTPDKVYLSKQRVSRLREIAKEVLEDADAAKTAKLKKDELVGLIARAFEAAAKGTSTAPAEVTRRLNAWIPPEMAIPDTTASAVAPEVGENTPQFNVA